MQYLTDCLFINISLKVTMTVWVNVFVLRLEKRRIKRLKFRINEKDIFLLWRPKRWNRKSRVTVKYLNKTGLWVIFPVTCGSCWCILEAAGWTWCDHSATRLLRRVIRRASTDNRDQIPVEPLLSRPSAARGTKSLSLTFPNSISTSVWSEQDDEPRSDVPRSQSRLGTSADWRAPGQGDDGGSAARPSRQDVVTGTMSFTIKAQPPKCRPIIRLILLLVSFPAVSLQYADDIFNYFKSTFIQTQCF